MIDFQRSEHYSRSCEPGHSPVSMIGTQFDGAFALADRVTHGKNYILRLESILPEAYRTLRPLL